MSEWLSRQQVVVLSAPETDGMVDVLDGELLREPDKHPPVAQQLASSALSREAYVQRLEPGVMAIGGPVGKPITNAVSRALHEWNPSASGWRYPSRIDPSETCWALYGDRVQVQRDGPVALSPDDPLHRAAVRSAAAYLEVRLPPDWA